MLYSDWAARNELTSSWIWIVNGFRQTDLTLTLGGKTNRIYQPIGAFGYMAQHGGNLIESSTDTITGDLKKSEGGSYSLSIENGSVSKIVTTLEVIDKKQDPEPKPDDRSKPNCWESFLEKITF